MNTSQGNAETTTTKRKRKSRLIEGGRRITRLQAKINDLPQESFTATSPTPKVLSREPASYPVSCEYLSPDAKILLKYGRFSRSAKRFEEPENASGPRPEIPTNEYDELEGHSSSDYSPPSQAVIDNILESLSPRQLGSASFSAGAQREHVKLPPNLSQAMVSSKTRESRDILLAEVPQIERERNDPASIPLVANTFSTWEYAMALNVGEEMLDKNANPNSTSGHFNQTVSFGLSEMVGMWGENDSDLDVEASSA
ncbi:hypothetical protein JCGZ_08288 [Jatropha curcas]|uniref:Uncharacterized protein n=1 Tax=Jatropha curcas TaxID=180498 RepID=A0A067KMT9_JATCU|nr:uncharacterized protein LOC105634626 isoform X2 [Jatropha curcas]KDP37447.1 hypothetical protein JCGZ_08288 [Jatropha curcas]